MLYLQDQEHTVSVQHCTGGIILEFPSDCNKQDRKKKKEKKKHPGEKRSKTIITDGMIGYIANLMTSIKRLLEHK